MNEFETKAGQGSVNELGMLRLLVSVALFLVCVVVCCVWLLMRQNLKDLSVNLDQAQKAYEGYESVEAKRASVIFTRLHDYAKSHPDFQPIMQTTDRYLMSIQSQ